MQFLTHKEVYALFNLGKLHNYHPPRSFARITNNEVHNSTADAYFDDDLRLHRIGAPAFTRRMTYGRIEEYWVHGKLHREDDWAVVRYDHNNDIISAERWKNGGRTHVLVDGVEYHAPVARK